LSFCDQPWRPPPTVIFRFFRNLNVFIRNNKRFELFELKVMAALLNAFGLSLSSGGKTSSFFGLPSEPVSKSSIEEWVRRVEAKLSFDPKPHEYPVIAVDSWLSVVKRGAWVSYSTCGLG